MIPVARQGLERISRADYEAAPGVNYSLLKSFAETPMHARHKMLNPEPPTAALALGDALHAALLSPDTFEADYPIAPKVDRRTKVGRAEWDAWKATHPGALEIDADDRDTILGMTAAAHAHPFAGAILRAPGRIEAGGFWNDTDTGAPCKLRADKIVGYGGYNWVVDFKSCISAAPWAFANAVAKHNYHAQDGWYMNGLNTIKPWERRFIFIALEKTPPWAVAVYELDPYAAEIGLDLCRKWLRLYLECEATGVWPGYAAEPVSLSLPKWALPREEFL